MRLIKIQLSLYQINATTTAGKLLKGWENADRYAEICASK